MTHAGESNAALLAAVKAGDLSAAEQALAAGANVNAPSPHHVTPLLEAVAEGQAAIVKWLVEHGAVTNYTGMSEGSPLMLAAYFGHVDCLQALLAAGANPNLAMPGGGETALHMAAVTKQTAAAQVLLHSGVNPNLHVAENAATSMFDGNARLWSETPLHFAAAYGDEEMVRAMLDAGADRLAMNVHGERPLAYAGRHQRSKEIREMLK